jgi:hypothetical protein
VFDFGHSSNFLCKSRNLVRKVDSVQVAKARALRDALHISICSVEELTIGNGSAPEASAASSPAKAPQPDKVTEPQLRVLRMQAEQLGLRDEDCTRFNTMTKKEASETISAFNRQLNMARVG